MSFLQKAREKQAQGIIAGLEKRNMNGYYFHTAQQCAEKILEMIPAASSISWGGSESIKQCALPEKLKEKGIYEVLDRSEYTTPEQQKEFYIKAFCSDYFLMSTNAITLDGELINIDGNGNRVASLIFGPEHVFIVAGMNKVVATVEDGIKRTRDIASPPNTIRLQKNTPCSVTGRCGDCMSPDCICNQIVITRRSREKQRIHVFLVGEDLGF